MKVLVTGAGGMLGQDVVARLAHVGHDAVATGRKEGLLPLDVTDTEAARKTLETLRPDAVIHCAAWTNVDGAEREPDGAYRGNALGAWNVASAAAHVGAWMVYVSTDFVFDGEKGSPYTEFDRVNPLGVYGASKEAGEQLVRQILPQRHIIARTSWLYGRGGPCFPKTILRLAEKSPEVPVVSDQIGTPTATVNLARKLVELAENPLPGTYHVSDTGHCSWYDFARAIVQNANLSTPIVPITAAEYAARFNSPTRRPAYSVMQPLSLSLRGMNDMPPWEDALAQFQKGEGRG